MGVLAVFTVAGANGQTSYPATVLADAPAAYWRMGDLPGSPYSPDASGHLEPAIAREPVYFGQMGALQDTLNGSVGLTGEGYFTTSLFQDNVSQYSLEAWVNTRALIAPILQDRGADDVNKGDSLSITLSIGQPELVDGAVHCGIDGDYIFVRGVTDITVNDGAWHHVVCVFNGVSGQVITPSQFTIYVDGRARGLKYQSNSSPLAPVSGSNGTTIGIHPIWEQANGMPRYVGLLDEVAVYGHALTAAQVLAHYEAGRCPIACE